MIHHRSLPTVGLQKTRVIQNFCLRFCERASIRSPPDNHLCPNFFSDRGIYDAEIILGRIQGGTEPMWPRFFCTRLRSGMGGNSLAFYLPSSIGLPQLNVRNTITLELHERACWPEIYLDHGGAHPRALKCFSSFFVFFCLVFIFFQTKSK